MIVKWQQTPCLLLLIALSTAAPLLHAADDEDDDERVSMTLEEAEATVQQVLQAAPTTKGADSCLKCHDEDNDYPIMGLFKTRHATVADPRSPFANEQCESCHGSGGEHMKKAKRGQPKAPIFNFGKDAWTPAKEQNARCLT